MKYIRTKYELYDVSDLYVAEHLTEKPYCVIGSGWCIYKDSIVKEADEIKDLCDTFVVGKYIWDDFEAAKRWARENNETINGAIWTDRGLLFVAKTDSKYNLHIR